MTEAHREAVKLAQFYLRRIAEGAGWWWDGDNDTEIEMMIGFIIGAAQAGLREDLGHAEQCIRELANELASARMLIRALDRLRPTCVICTDATADRQTSRGPACTDCVGDLPDDGADPDRPETWSFGEAPLTAYPDHGLLGRGDDPDEPTNRDIEPEPPGWYDVPGPEESR